MDEFLDSENRSPFPVAIGWTLVAIAIGLGVVHFLAQAPGHSSLTVAAFSHDAAYPLRVGALIVGALALTLFLLAGRRFTERFTFGLNIIAVILLLIGIGIAAFSWHQWEQRLRPVAEYQKVAAKFVTSPQEKLLSVSSDNGAGWLSRYAKLNSNGGPNVVHTWSIPTTDAVTTCQGLPQRLAVYGTAKLQTESPGFACVYAVRVAKPEPGANVVVYVTKSATAADPAQLNLAVSAY